MNEPIPDDKPYATFVFNHEGRQYVAREDYERLRAEAVTQAQQIEDAAATIASLRTEVRTLRQEVAALREERRMLIDADLPPGTRGGDEVKG